MLTADWVILCAIIYGQLSTSEYSIQLNVYLDFKNIRFAILRKNKSTYSTVFIYGFNNVKIIYLRASFVHGETTCTVFDLINILFAYGI